MTKINHGRAVAVLLASLLAVLAVAPIARAQTVGTASFPGTPGAIAFVSERDGFDVYRMNADGFGQTPLTDTSGMNLSPSWSADGTKIAFTNTAAVGAPGEVYQMGADGSNETNLTNASSDDGSPAYSRTSGKFAFVSTRVGSQSDIYLATLGPDGQTTGLTRLTTSDKQDIGPAISPDGKRLAFQSDRDGDFDVYVMRLAREGPRNVPIKLTRNRVFDFSPDWSPDGTQLAFASDRNREIYRMNASPGRDVSTCPSTSPILLPPATTIPPGPRTERRSPSRPTGTVIRRSTGCGPLTGPTRSTSPTTRRWI